MKSYALLAMWVAVLCTGCRGRDMRAYPRISNSPLVVIAHDANGMLLDYLAVDDLASVHEIIVHPPTRPDEVLVTVYGRSLHETLHSDMSIGTKRAEDYLGKITISVENGIVLRVDGNSISAPSPVTRSTLENVESYIAGTVHRPNLEQLIRIEKAEQEAGGYRR